MQTQILPSLDTSYLDPLLFQEDGSMRCLPADQLLQIPNTLLRLWCHRHAIYGIPSNELIDTIKQHIGDASCIEVGAGCGVFGKLLNIPSTDSFIQATPEMKMLYAQMGQPPVNYGKNVLNYEATKAIEHFKPDVVFGSWVTQHHPENSETPLPGGGSIYGLKETEFFSHIKKYIVYGNEQVHGRKELFSMPGVKVTRIKDPLTMLSRAAVPDDNCLYVIEHE
jgi:hypothetical protein